MAIIIVILLLFFNKNFNEMNPDSSNFLFRNRKFEREKKIKIRLKIWRENRGDYFDKSFGDRKFAISFDFD